MKKFHYIYLLLLMFISTSVFGQNNCPILDPLVVSTCGVNQYTVRACWTSMGNNQKKVHITFQNILDVCVDAKNSGCHEETFSSPVYPTGLKVESYSGGNCTGTPCNVSVLSVELNYFAVSRNQFNVILKWQTANEQDSKEFLVERSSNAVVWEVIKTIPSKALGGNSSIVLDYEYVDLNPEKAITYYRVRQISLNQDEQITQIRSVKGYEQIGLLVYPNPNEGVFQIHFSESNTKSITMFDSRGKPVRQWVNITGDSFIAYVSELKPGIYFVKTSTGEVAKVVILK